MLILTLTAFLISLTAVNLIRRYLKQYLVDIPNNRSSHKIPTPRGGGLGFIVAFAICLITSQLIPGKLGTTIVPQIWLSLLPLIFISLLDDWKTLRASIRYPVQLFVSVLIVLQTGAFSQPWLSQFGVPGDMLAIILTIVGITALINFYNFMDGLDGLVAGVSLVQVTFCAIALHQPILWLLAGSLLGFLVWNWSPAKIFMGDAGSTALGAVMAIALLESGMQSEATPATTWSNLAITLPLIADAIYTLARRSLRRENIFQAHRTHLYQRLNQSGWTHATVATLYISAATVVAVSLLMLGSWGAWISLVGSLVAIVQVESYLQRVNQSRLIKTLIPTANVLSALIDQKIESKQDIS